MVSTHNNKVHPSLIEISHFHQVDRSVDVLTDIPNEGIRSYTVLCSMNWETYGQISFILILAKRAPK